MKHAEFLPLSRPGGDGKNDIALLVIKTKQGRGITFDKFVSPACLPGKRRGVKRWACGDCLILTILFRWEGSHCEIGGWGMQEYNNTDSYPDSARAATIKVRSLYKDSRKFILPTLPGEQHPEWSV